MKVKKIIPNISFRNKKNLTPEDERLKKHTLKKRRSRGLPSKSKILTYLGAFLLIASVVSIGYRNDNQSQSVIKLSSLSDTTNSSTEVDPVLAVQLASGLAQTAEIPIATNVANLKVSAEIKSELSKSETSIITKPQILKPTASDRTITKHTVVTGETITSIANMYGLNTDTVKWANGISSDSVGAGKVLQILPVNGILYTVRSGDTYDSIASRYKVDVERIISYNDLEISGMTVGTQIILPDGVLPNTERPGYISPRYNYSFAIGGGGSDVTFLYVNKSPTTPGNTNAWGNCTWYVWERRYQMGGAWVLPSRALGNAAEWAYSLGNAGYRLDRKPSYGAIMQNGGGLGHVAFVESVEANGDVVVTEMNYGRWYNIVSRRKVTASYAANYNYIHEKVR
jgi:surface antigen